MPGTFQLVSFLPTDIDLVGKWLFQGNGVSMLLDQITGDVWATKCVWCQVYMGPLVPAAVRDLFVDMHG